MKTAITRHNNSFIFGAMISLLHLNIRHTPQHVLHSLSENLKRCIQQPFEKNLKNSFAEWFKLDQQRGLDSKEIFKELYNLKED